MRRISNPIGPNAVVALAVASVIAVSVGSGQVRADDCLAAPNAASPAGQHWYYRIDRVKQRKCWYLHAPQHVVHQAHGAAVAANAEIDDPAPAAPMPAPAAPMPAVHAPMPVPAPEPDNTGSLPHVTVLAVKTVAVPALEASAEAQSRHRTSAASVQNASARVYSATPERRSEPPLFFVLVFGLGVAIFLMAIVIKCVAPRAIWLSWSARSEADFAWPRQRRNYSGAARSRGG